LCPDKPIIGILAGVAGTGIDRPLTWWRKRLSAKVRHFNSFFFSILSLLLTIFIGRAYDIQMSEQSVTAQD
jgi:hypothetical protein